MLQGVLENLGNFQSVFYGSYELRILINIRDLGAIDANLLHLREKLEEEACVSIAGCTKNPLNQ